ncbi:MAG TPA: hypothetical protein VJU80_09065 [Solirubrobacteraceae bacterium]|nr:hypothetical protein [Solirubrobacteraceae bacterium]
MSETPIYDALITEHPDVPAMLARPRWSYAEALKEADAAIIARPIKMPRKRATKAARK